MNIIEISLNGNPLNAAKQFSMREVKIIDKTMKTVPPTRHSPPPDPTFVRIRCRCGVELLYHFDGLAQAFSNPIVHSSNGLGLLKSYAKLWICCFQIESMLRSNETNLPSYLPHQAWEIESVTCQRNVNWYVGCPQPYIVIEYTFLLGRKPGFARDLFIIPAVILALLVHIVFTLPVTDAVSKYWRI